MCLPAVRAAGGGRCMMLAAARVFSMEPGALPQLMIQAPPTVLILWPGRGGVWCACPLSGPGVGGGA